MTPKFQNLNRALICHWKVYRESVLTQLVDFYQKRRPRTGVCDIKLLHDNAPAHKSATVQEYLKESGLDILDHPPYSPDLYLLVVPKTKGNAGRAPF